MAAPVPKKLRLAQDCGTEHRRDHNADAEEVDSAGGLGDAEPLSRVVIPKILGRAANGPTTNRKKCGIMVLIAPIFKTAFRAVCQRSKKKKKATSWSCLRRCSHRRAPACMSMPSLPRPLLKRAFTRKDKKHAPETLHNEFLTALGGSALGAAYQEWLLERWEWRQRNLDQALVSSALNALRSEFAQVQYMEVLFGGNTRSQTATELLEYIVMPKAEEATFAKPDHANTSYDRVVSETWESCVGAIALHYGHGKAIQWVRKVVFCGTMSSVQLKIHHKHGKPTVTYMGDLLCEKSFEIASEIFEGNKADSHGRL